MTFRCGHKLFLCGLMSLTGLRSMNVLLVYCLTESEEMFSLVDSC